MVWNNLAGILCFIILVLIENAYGKFSCDGRITGYYADVDSGCQVYHMCDGIGRQFSYTCPNATLFQQRMLVCDHWYMVNCSKAENDYNANSLIGQRDQPFVVDTVDNPYHRTPRPDLLSHPSENEYNIIYRNTKGQAGSSGSNIVGAPTDDENSDSNQQSNTDEPVYFLPSHWSTQFDKYSTTEKTTNFVNTYKQKQFVSNPSTSTRTNLRRTTTKQRVTTPVVRQTTPNPPTALPHVNFKSNFKATTPVYPKTVENAGDDFIIQELPPIPSQPHVNFKSDYKATTPVYPKTVENAGDDFIIQELPPIPPQSVQQQQQPHKVNFDSNFQATTPVYPKAFELPKLEPDNDIGLQPPLPYKLAQETTTTEQPQTVIFESSFKATTPVYPKAFELPKIDSDNDIGLIPPQPFNQPLNVAKAEEVAVNFASNFKATTPVYPKSVESTSPIPDSVGLLPPSEGEKEELNQQSPPTLSTLFLPPNVETKYARVNNSDELNTPRQAPSKFYQPPKFEPDYTEDQNQKTQNQNVQPIIVNNGNIKKYVNMSQILKSLNNDQWRNIRKMFLIPDFEFPLESASRPSYESILNSFDANTSSPPVNTTK